MVQPVANISILQRLAGRFQQNDVKPIHLLALEATIAEFEGAQGTLWTTAEVARPVVTVTANGAELASLDTGQDLESCLHLHQKSEAGIYKRGHILFAILPVTIDGSAYAFEILIPEGDPKGLPNMVETQRVLGELMAIESPKMQSPTPGIGRFAETVNASLELDETAFCVANELLLYCQVDRVSVLVRQGNHHRLLAVSGESEINRRANSVKGLQALTTAVLRIGERLVVPNESELPPEIEQPLQFYVEVTHAKHLRIEPLAVGRRRSRKTSTGQLEQSAKHDIVGAVVLETFQAPISKAGEDFLRQALPHAAIAVDNAQNHESIFLLPVWKSIGRSWRWVREEHARLAAAIVIGLLGLLLFSLFYPADFYIAARGELQPIERRTVFAVADGTIDDVLVEHRTPVAQDQVVAKMRNPELEKQLEQVIGSIRTTSQQLTSVQSIRVRGAGSEDAQLAAQEAQYREELNGLQQQREVLTEQLASLDVRSPIQGQVLTWQVRDNLLTKPVSRGDALIDVGKTEGDWGLELHVPDHRAGHVMEAATDNSLPVVFSIGTNPEQRYQGSLDEISTATSYKADAGATVLMKVAFDKSQVIQLQAGAGVDAKILCGKRSLFFVWTREVREFLYRRVFFHLW